MVWVEARYRSLRRDEAADEGGLPRCLFSGVAVSLVSVTGFCAVARADFGIVIVIEVGNAEKLILEVWKGCF